MERVTIIIDKPEVGIHYQPETSEAETGDELAASELGLHALAQHIVALREQLGLRVPSVLRQVIEANTWREFL
jgi:hypothetical protein